MYVYYVFGFVVCYLYVICEDVVLSKGVFGVEEWCDQVVVVVGDEYLQVSVGVQRV